MQTLDGSHELKKDALLQCTVDFAARTAVKNVFLAVYLIQTDMWGSTFSEWRLRFPLYSLKKKIILLCLGSILFST